MTKQVKINVVNATVLDPTKYYIIEVSNKAYTKEDIHDISKHLCDSGVRGIVMIRHGDDEIKIIEANK